MTLFLQGTAQFWQAMGPMVMQQPAIMPTVAEVYTAFARNFKLGRQAEAALDGMADQAKTIASQPPEPDPAIEMKKQEMAMRQAETQAKMQADQSVNVQKLDFEREKHQQEMAFAAQKHEAELAMRGQEMQVNVDMAREKNAIDADLMREKHALDADTKREQIAASSKPAAEIKLDANDAVKEIAPAFQDHMAASANMMVAAVQGLAQAASALDRVAEVMAADSEIIRDKNGRAVRSRKVMPQRVMQ